MLQSNFSPIEMLSGVGRILPNCPFPQYERPWNDPRIVMERNEAGAMGITSRNLIVEVVTFELGQVN